MTEKEPNTPVERLIDRDRDGNVGYGKPLSMRARQTQRSLEDYLKAGNRPRWMERLGEIEFGIKAERRRIERAYRALQRECGDDAEAFADRWRATAAAWRFDDLNELIAQHNEWFPIERQLPVDPRTRDYVLINGRSYRHEPLDAAWILRAFPPRP